MNVRFLLLCLPLVVTHCADDDAAVNERHDGGSSPEASESPNLDASVQPQDGGNRGDEPKFGLDAGNLDPGNIDAGNLDAEQAECFVPTEDENVDAGCPCKSEQDASSTLHCPMLSWDECVDLALDIFELVEVNNTCESDDECRQLGGVSSEDACNCYPSLPAYAFSVNGEVDTIRARFDELEQGGCADEVCDVAPQDVACVAGSCQLVGPSSCLAGPFDGDSGTDGGTEGQSDDERVVPMQN